MSNAISLNDSIHRHIENKRAPDPEVSGEKATDDDGTQKKQAQNIPKSQFSYLLTQQTGCRRCSPLSNDLDAWTIVIRLPAIWARLYCIHKNKNNHFGSHKTMSMSTAVVANPLNGHLHYRRLSIATYDHSVKMVLATSVLLEYCRYNVYSIELELEY